MKGFKYPILYQLPILRLQSLKLKQQLGDIYQSELDAYKEIKPNIEWHYNRCFEGRRRHSYWGVALGALAGGVLAFKRASYLSRVGTTVLREFCSSSPWSGRR